MALPALKDLLPDHLFHHPSTVRQPPPTKSILLHVPSSLPSHPEDPAVAPYPNRSPPPQLPPPLPFQSTIQSPFTPEPCPSNHSYDTRQGSIYEHAPLSQPHHDRSSAGDRFYGINMHPTRLDKDVIDKEDGDEEGKRKHPCPMCGKRFNRPSSLRIHLNTHTGAKPYVCPFAGCLRSFNVSSNMRRHFRNHARRVPPPLPIPAANFIMQPPQMDMRGVVQGRYSVEPSDQLPSVAESTSRLETERPERFGKANEVEYQSELNNAIAIRGAEAAARAVRRMSVSSAATSGMGLSPKQGHNAGMYARSVSRVEYPYPPSNDHPPPLTQAHPESMPHRLLSPTALGMAHGYSYAHEYPSEYTGASDDLSEERQISESEADKRGAAYHLAHLARGSGSAGASVSDYRRARILDKPEEEYPARFEHPPTPPYTNEAAQSPPSHPPALASSSMPATILNSTSRYAYTDDPRSSGLEPRASPESNIFEVGRECRDAAGTEHATSHVRLIPEGSLCPPGYGTKGPELASSYVPGRLEPGGRYRHEEERDRHSPARYDESPPYALQYAEPNASPRSLTCAVGHREEQEAGQARETRMRVRQQQPSPDTPSLHLVALHVDSTDESRARSTSPSVSRRNSAEKGEGETHSRGRHGVSISRSSFSLDAILHPYPSESKVTDEISTSVRTPTEPHTQTQTSQNEIETVGQMRTPGAAPPPPYPLHTYPPPLTADTPHECAGDERHEGSRSSKRRRRS